MNCARCATHMVSAEHQEREIVAEGVTLYTNVLLHECPYCAVTVRICIPQFLSENHEAL